MNQTSTHNGSTENDGLVSHSLYEDEWTETTFGEVCEIIMGQSPKGETYNLNGDGLPFYQGVT